MNYKKLLTEYMAIVISENGISFLDSLTEEVTLAEFAELLEIETDVILTQSVA